MRVQELRLRNFRNIRDAVFRPGKSLNFLVGLNGQGKTSILESLAFLSTLRSFRGSKTPEVMKWGEPSSEISCKIVAEDPAFSDWQTELKVIFDTPLGSDKATKVALINGKPYRSSTQYLTQRFGSFHLGFHTVVFNPADHDLVRDEPAVRRSYLDRVLAAEDADYLTTLSKYQKVLTQRNALLKFDERPSRDLLMGFTEPMAALAAQIASKRLQWIQKLEGRLQEIVQKFAPSQPHLRLTYLSSWVPEIQNLSLMNNHLASLQFSGQGELPSLELLEQGFWKKLSILETAELKSRYSLVGPHRDDWTFFIGNQILRGHGSQGEVRSALLALKLAEIELFQNHTGHRPLFLLDDFSSELDRNRRSFLLRFLMESDLQVFVTTTDFSSLDPIDLKIDKLACFKIDGGRILEENSFETSPSNDRSPNRDGAEKI